AVAQYVSRLVGGVPIVFEPSPPQDPTNRRPDLTNAHYVMPDWSCNITYEQGLAMTLDGFRDQMRHAAE
ncbi:UDP-glucose 4-epimerase, partial [Rhizobium leguminosarum]